MDSIALSSKDDDTPTVAGLVLDPVSTRHAGLEAMLTPLRPSLTFATSTQDAQAYTQVLRFDFLLARMDGAPLEAIERLHRELRRDAGGLLPVIGLSAANDNTPDWCTQVSLPMRPRTLRDAVARAIGLKPHGNASEQFRG